MHDLLLSRYALMYLGLKGRRSLTVAATRTVRADHFLEAVADLKVCTNIPQRSFLICYNVSRSKSLKILVLAVLLGHETKAVFIILATIGVLLVNWIHNLGHT